MSIKKAKKIRQMSVTEIKTRIAHANERHDYRSKYRLDLEHELYVRKKRKDAPNDAPVSREQASEWFWKGIRKRLSDQARRRARRVVA